MLRLRLAAISWHFVFGAIYYRRNVYCIGHNHLCVCVCVCVCVSVPRHIPTLLHGPGCNWENGRGAL